MKKNVENLCLPQFQAKKDGRWKPEKMSKAAESEVFDHLGKAALHYIRLASTRRPWVKKFLEEKGIQI
jgi:hypothetical protein